MAVLESADVIIAPPGSALTTLLFCHGRKRIVEIETKTSYRTSLYAALGHEAVRVPSQRTNIRAGHSVEALAYEVDLDTAARAVEWAVHR